MSGVAEERVLVFPGEVFDRLGRFQGLSRDVDRYLPVVTAETNTCYRPRGVTENDPSFKQYRNWDRVWSQQIDEIKRTGGRSGDTRFYYSGMAQAALLDRLLPNWKDRAFEPGIVLEELLKEAVRP